MKNKTMIKSYNITNIILTIMTFVIFNIMFINEPLSSRIIVSIIFPLIVFAISYPTSMISRIIFNIGSKLKKKTSKVLYYVFLPIIILILLSLIIGIMYYFFDKLPTPIDFASALGQALTFLFIITLVTICIILPYIQTLIVLIVNHFIKD